MAKFIPKILDKVLTHIPSPTEQEIVSYASKIMRAKIAIYDRNFRGFDKIDVNGPRDSYEYEETYGGYNTKTFKEIITKGDINRTTGIDNSGHIFDNNTRASIIKKDTIIRDSISIIDIDYNPDTNNNTNQDTSKDKPKLSNRRYKSLTLPFVPRELEFRPETNFVGISSFGRNNPFYQYTGAEDTLTFEIDWLASNNNREDVITQCRWIEALTKGDGYDDTPHRIILMWGKDNKLFENYQWIITAAPYKLKNFNRGYIGEDGNFINTHMLPTQAYQQITLKRITDNNLSSADIIGKLNP